MTTNNEARELAEKLLEKDARTMTTPERLSLQAVFAVSFPAVASALLEAYERVEMLDGLLSRYQELLPEHALDYSSAIGEMCPLAMNATGNKSKYKYSLSMLTDLWRETRTALAGKRAEG